jgi:hypothetical protein
MQEITENQKKIYNIYLKNFRYKKPFQYRKDFNDISEYTILNLKKLDYFFSKFKNINIEDFFEAPNLIYENQPYPKLDYFNTRSAIRAYSISNKQKEDQNPEKQFDSIKESFLFIMKFCLEEKISIEHYINHKSGLIFSWMNHYRERKINPYSLMEMGDIIKTIDETSKDILDIFSNDLSNKIIKFKIRYNSSQKSVDFVKRGTEKIKNFIKKELQIQK